MWQDDCVGSLQSLADYCCRGRRSWELDPQFDCALEETIRSQIVSAWRSFHPALNLSVSFDQPEMRVEGDTVGWFGVTRLSGSELFICVASPRTFNGDEPLAPLILESDRVVPSLAWDIGTAFALPPSFRLSATVSALAKRGRGLASPHAAPPAGLLSRVLAALRLQPTRTSSGRSGGGTPC